MKRGLSLLILLVAFLSGRATMIHNHLSISDGLNDDTVNVICRDSTGYIWFGTEAGLNRFDGNHIVRYDYPQSVGGMCKVSDLLCYSNNKNGVSTIFAITPAGLFMTPQKGIVLERALPKNVKNSVKALSRGEGNDLWIATKEELFILNVETKKYHTVKTGEEFSKIGDFQKILFDSKDKCLWILSSKALSKYYPKSNKLISYPLESKPGRRYMTKVNDIIYISTKTGEGLLRFDTKSSKFLPSLSFGNNIFNSISGDSQGNLILVVDCDGIYVYSPTTKRVTTYLNPLNSDLKSESIFSSIKDDTGILWAGLYQGGVDYIETADSQFEKFISKQFPELSNTRIRAVAIEPDFKLIGTHNGLYYINDKGNSRKISKPEIGSEIIFSIRKYNGVYYIGTYRGGIYIFDPKTNKITDFCKEKNMDSSMSCLDIESDKKGNLWFATSKGIYKLDSHGKVASLESFTRPLPGGYFYYIFFDSKGRGWFTNETQVLKLENDKLEEVKFPKKYPNMSKTRYVYEDYDHNLYFVPHRGNVLKTDSTLSKFENIPFGSEVSPTTYFITDDSDSHIYFGTNTGLYGYDRKTESFSHAYVEELKNPAFTYCRPFKTENGDIWLGNSSGLVKFTPSKSNQLHSQSNKFSITYLKSGNEIFGNRFDSESNNVIKLPAADQELTIHLSDFSFDNPKNLLLNYKLEGFDNKWREIYASQSIHYDRLPAGKYKLHVFNSISPKNITTFEIIVPGESHAWIWIFIILFIISLSIAIYIYRKRKVNRSIIDANDSQNTESIPVEIENPEKRKESSYSMRNFSEEECLEIIGKLDALMIEEKPYKKPNLRIHELASMVGSSSLHLSYILNTYKDGYYNYINAYRVNDFKEFVKNGEAQKYTLTAIALKCGFSSRTSFFRHFKAITGITPSIYMKDCPHVEEVPEKSVETDI